jgi:acid phosphatase type 7
MQEIDDSGGITFHTVVDTGGFGYAVPQQIIEMHMENDFDTNNPQINPAFFYHLGDIVYLYGEADNYPHYEAVLSTLHSLSITNLCYTRKP